MRHVLAHERYLCLCLYWFNPLVWWAAAMSYQDCELACDAAAIRCIGEGEWIPYGRTLVTLVGEGRISLFQAAATMTESKRRMRERVRLIAHGPKTVIALTLAALLLVGCAVGCPLPARRGMLGSRLTWIRTPLEERLMDVPKELTSQVHVEYEPGWGIAYCLDLPVEWLELWSGWLLGVYQWNQAQLDEILSDGSWSKGLEVFAKGGDYYYCIILRDNWQYRDEEEKLYWELHNTIRDYVKVQVLAAEGVRPFDQMELDILSVPAQAVKHTVSWFMQEPSLELTLTFDSKRYSYSTVPSQDAGA